MVLDEQDRQVQITLKAADEVSELADLLVIEPAGGLVEQEQGRLGRESARELDSLERAERKSTGKPLAEFAELEIFEDMLRLFAAATLRERTKPRVRADEHVLEDGHVLEQHDVLKRARDPESRHPIGRCSSQVFPLEHNAAAVRAVEAGDEIEERRLPGAVRPDQPDDLSLLQVERNIRESHDPTEPARDVLDRKKRHRTRDDMTVPTEYAFRRWPVMDRGVVLSEVGRFGLEEIEVDAPGENEVLVRIEASGVCHSDLHLVETGWAHRLPVLLGHEGAGVVEEVGGAVTTLAPGDRVVLGWRSPCGACRWCVRGDVRRCRTPPGVRDRLHLADGRSLSQTLQLGTFATRTVVHSAAAIPVADELPAEQACLIGCSVATGIGSVLNTAEVWAGARVAVIGCGAVGLSVVQGARLAGASEIFALDLEERKLAAAERFGATHRGPGEKLDFVFDVVGRPKTVVQGLDMLGHAGTLVYIGLPQPGAAAAIDLQQLFDRRLRVVVSHGGDHVPAVDFPQLVAWAREGKIDLAGMVTKRVGLEDVAPAFDDLKSGEVIRSVILF